jgi:hypothetical protein
LGSFYITSKYYALGIASVEGFDFHEVLKNAATPLLMPGFLLALFAAFCQAKARPEWRRPGALFAPVPISAALAALFTVWFFKVVSDYFHPVGSMLFHSYKIRDIGWFVVGALALLAAWSHYRLVALGRPAKQRSRSGSVLYRACLVAGPLLFAYAVSGWVGIRWQAIASVALAVAGMGFLILRDLRRSRGENDGSTGLAQVESTENVPDATDAPSSVPGGASRAGRILVGCWIVIVVVLSASFSGMAEAARMKAGCDSYDRVRVLTPHPALNSTRNYWLILEKSGTTYLRGLPGQESNVTISIPTAGLALERTRMPRLLAC